MKYFLLFLFFVLSSATVIQLTSENFDEVVNGEKNVFVKFYAPWCGHCKNLAPEYELYAEAMSKVDNLIVAEVNADEDKDLAQRFEIRGYPTLKFFPAGEAQEPIVFKGERSAVGLVEWTNEKLGTHVVFRGPPSNVKTLTPATFDSVVLDKSKVVFVKFFAPWCGHCKALAPVFSKLADIFVEEDSVVIAELDADKYRSIAERYEVSGYPTLKIFIHGEVKDYVASRSLDDMMRYINHVAGTARQMDGSIDSSYGHISEVDQKLVTVHEYTPEEVEELVELVSKAPEEKAHSKKVYLSILKKIQANGVGYVKSEKERMEKFIVSEQISKAKKGIFRLRSNILDAFIVKDTSNEEL